MYENKDGNTTSIEDTIEDTSANIEEHLLKTELHDKIKETIEKLDDRESEVVKLLCGFDCIRKTQEQVAEELNISQAQVSRVYKNALSEIAFLLPKSISDTAKKERITDNIFVDKGEKEVKTIFTLYPLYSKKQILEVVDSLNELDKKIIELKYGLNGNKIFNNMEISEMLNMDSKRLGVRIVQLKTKIGNILKNGMINKRTFYNLFPNYTKNQILEVLNLINENNKKIIELKYGLDDNQRRNNKEISEILNVDKKVINSRLYMIKQQIKNRLENSQPKSKKPKSITSNSILQVFPGYTEEQILEAVSKLNETNKKIMELRFGLNGNSVTDYTEISKILSLNSTNIGSRLFQSKKQIKSNLEKTTSKKTEFINSYSGYTEEQILEAIENIPELNKKIIELKYGLNGNTILENKEIAKQLNIEPKVINSRLYMIKQQIKNRLENIEKYNPSTVSCDKENDKNNDKVELVNFDERPKFGMDEKTLNVYQTKIKELENSILSKEETKEDKIFGVNHVMIELNVNETPCLFARQDKKTNGLDRAHGLKKDCYVYVVRATDTRKKEKIYENILIEDKKTGEFFNFVKRYTNGDYDLSNLKYNELVCYDVGKSGISLLPSPTEQVKKENDIKEVTKVEKKATIVNNQIDNEKYKQCIDTGIKLFKDRQIVLAEPEFIEALKSNDKFVLQKANYYLGKVYLAKKKALIAEKYLKDSLEYNETDYLTLLETGKSLLMQNKYNEAITYFDKCNVVGKPFYTMHILEKAKCYIKQKDFDTALKLFDSCIDRKVNDYFAHYEKGKLLFDLKNYKEARKELELCESLDYKRPNHKVILGKIEYIENNIKEATDYFEECIDIDHEHNTIYNIVNIAYFFHERGDKDIAYDYYLEAPVFKKWCKLTEEQVDEHIKQHNSVTKDAKMHSVFNFPVSIDILNDLIKDMEKTTTRELYDVYQIYCRDVGYMVIDDNNQQMEDYITILTLPFTKKIMNSYPDNRIENVKITKSITLDSLNNYNLEHNVKIAENDLEIIDDIKTDTQSVVENKKQEQKEESVQYKELKIESKEEPKVEEIQQDNDNEKIEYKPSIQTTDTKEIIDDIKTDIQSVVENKKQDHKEKSVQYEELKIESKVEEIQQDNDNEKPEYKPSVQPTDPKEVVDESEVTLIKNKFDIPVNLDFEKHKEQIKMLINMLNNPTEQVILLLRLGFVNDKYYTEEEIAKFLNISEIDVHYTISRSLSNIVGISTLTIQRVESVRQQLDMTKNLTKQNN